MMTQFKTHILCILESCVSAVYHAADSALKPLDRIWGSFLDEIGLTPEASFLEFNMAPLCVRRDIAMLGMLHKCTLQTAHPRLQELFPSAPQADHLRRTRSQHLKHNRQLVELCKGNFLEIMRRSVFGLVRVYNLLPHEVVWTKTVQDFQKSLTELLRSRCESGMVNWELSLSPRHTRQG